MIIYISGPYSAPTQAQVWNNVFAATDAGVEIREKGHYPLVPHLYDEFDAMAKLKGTNFTWQDYIDMDLAFLERCDALLYLGSSKGADIELARAKELGLPIFYSVDEVPDVGASADA